MAERKLTANARRLMTPHYDENKRPFYDLCLTEEDWAAQAARSWNELPGWIEEESQREVLTEVDVHGLVRKAEKDFKINNRRK